jgi:hypothetical protein
MSELPEKSDNPEIVHEESDVNVGAILRFGIGLAVVALVVHVFLWWLLGVYQRQQNRAHAQAFPMAAGQQNRLPPSPRFQENPQQELQDLRVKQRGVLEEYSWVNKEAGIARIPIEEAMKIVVERGLPTREAQK